MNKNLITKVVYGFIILIILILFSLLLTSIANAEDVDAEDVGIPNGYHVITWVSPDQMSYRAKWVSPEGLSYACEYEANYDCVTGGLPQKIGDVCVKIGNQKLQCSKQDLRWTKTEKSECKGYLPISFIDRTPPIPCCTTCKMCYEYGSGTGKDFKWIRDLGCVEYGNGTTTFLPGKPVQVYAGYSIKAYRVCSQPNIPNISKAWLDIYKSTSGQYVYYSDLTNKFADNSGYIDCVDMGKQYGPFRTTFEYWDNNCPCKTGLYQADP